MIDSKMEKRAWSVQHDQFLAANYGKATDKMIALCLSRPVSDVKHRANFLGLKKYLW